jgi:hypothetical protein
MRNATLRVLAGAIVVVAACDSAATASNIADTVQTVDTVRTDTIHVADTVRTVDTVHVSDTLQGVSYYLVAFHEDSSVAFCSQSPCPVVPGTGEFKGSITEHDDSMFVAFGHVLYDGLPMTSVHLDSLPTQFQWGCRAFVLNMTRSPTTLRGRWAVKNACDGTLGLRGTFVGTPQ